MKQAIGTHYVRNPSDNLEIHARRMIGDGKTPNKYFVSISSDYYATLDDGEMQWASEIIKDLKTESILIGEFDSFEEAKNKANEFELKRKSHGIFVNSVMIEDRISGEVYQRIVSLNLTNARVFEEEHEDTGFSQEKLGDQFK